MVKVPGLAFIFISAIAFSVFSQTSSSHNPSFGLGIIVGEPTGISVKFWKTPHSGFDGAAAWSFRQKAALHLHADYLLHNFTILKSTNGGLSLFYGIGARVKFQKETKLGIRIPVGINYRAPTSPLEFFLEFVPIMELIPATELVMNGGFGLRYYF